VNVNQTGSPTPGTQAASAATSGGATAPATGTKTLGKDAFLSLLVTQLKNQDPTAPMDDTAFVAQLATFSSLEKLTTIDTSLSSMLALMKGPDPTTSSPNSGAATGTNTGASTGTNSGTSSNSSSTTPVLF